MDPRAPAAQTSGLGDAAGPSVKASVSEEQVVRRKTPSKTPSKQPRSERRKLAGEAGTTGQGVVMVQAQVEAAPAELGLEAGGGGDGPWGNLCPLPRLGGPLSALLLLSRY